MAYRRSIDVECQWGGCVKRANSEVFTTKNESVGKFCSQHAERHVVLLCQQERAKSS